MSFPFVLVLSYLSVSSKPHCAVENSITFASHCRTDDVVSARTSCPSAGLEAFMSSCLKQWLISCRWAISPSAKTVMNTHGRGRQHTHIWTHTHRHTCMHMQLGYSYPCSPDTSVYLVVAPIILSAANTGNRSSGKPEGLLLHMLHVASIFNVRQSFDSFKCFFHPEEVTRWLFGSRLPWLH